MFSRLTLYALLALALYSCLGSDKDTAPSGLPGADGYLVCELEWRIAKDAPIPAGGDGWWCDTGDLYSAPSTVYCVETDPERVYYDDTSVATLSGWSTMSSDDLYWYKLEASDEEKNFLYFDYNGTPSRCVAYVWEG